MLAVFNRPVTTNGVCQMLRLRCVAADIQSRFPGFLVADHAAGDGDRQRPQIFPGGTPGATGGRFGPPVRLTDRVTIQKEHWRAKAHASGTRRELQLLMTNAVCTIRQVKSDFTVSYLKTIHGERKSQLETYSVV